jgi:uncharacterized membrane protein
LPSFDPFTRKHFGSNRILHTAEGTPMSERIPMDLVVHERIPRAAARLEKRPVERVAPKVNIGPLERQLSLVGGTVLAILGLIRRDVPGLFAAGAGAGLVYRGATGHCGVYDALGVSSAAKEQPESSRAVHVVETFLINKPAEQLYKAWRDFERLPTIMSHLKSVRVIDDRRSHWIAQAPALSGGSVEWDAEITDDQPNSRIAWQSLPGAAVVNAGSVEFQPAPGSRGTIVRVRLKYEPPAGQLGSWIARLFGDDPAQTIREDLRNFKRYMEVGEVLTTEGQPRGACMGGIGRLMS